MTIGERRFRYSEMVGRNLGFVTAEEQERLRDGSVFVCGVGGMGGACLMSLARAGLGRVIVADLDTFELSNLNRQLFADLDSVDQPKVDATVRQLRLINPEMEIETHGGDWVDHLDGILGRAPVVINGMDDIPCGIHLYRRARAGGATVIDAYTSPLPSVTVVAPGDPRPEERLGFPSDGKDWRALDEDDIAGSMRRELEYVMTHSSSRHHVDLDVAAEMVRGDRPRMSFAPMVITAGSLMAFEAVNLLLERPSGTDCRGYFFNPWTVRVERPRHPLGAALMGFVVRRFLDRLIDAD
ncbi:MAG: ThiF family adenylyltransferase [Acidobacteriota bacterium]